MNKCEILVKNSRLSEISDTYVYEIKSKRNTRQYTGKSFTSQNVNDENYKIIVSNILVLLTKHSKSCFIR